MPRRGLETAMSDAIEGWREEKQSAWLYRRVAEAEPDPELARLFAELAGMAEEQAETWQAIAARSGLTPPAFTPSPRVRLVATLLKRWPPRQLRPVLAAMKIRGLSALDRVYTGIGVKHPEFRLGELEAHHRSDGGGTLRATIFGVNDGLVSNTALVMGVAGATADPQTLVTAGVAGLLAGALSMAAGEWISMQSQKEFYEYQIGLEREEFAAYPEEEAEELALIYAARGMPLEQARETARTLLADPEHALDVLAREELGLNPDELGSPWGAAFGSFFAFVSGAIVPLLPFLFGMPSVSLAAVCSAVALFVVGAALSLFTGRQALAGGLRMLLIGGAAAAITWLIGTLLGAAIA